MHLFPGASKNRFESRGSTPSFRLPMRFWWNFCLLSWLCLAAQPQTPVPTKPPVVAASPAGAVAIVPPATAPGVTATVSAAATAATAATATSPTNAPVVSPAAERATYDAAIREFDASLFDRAARSLADFVTAYPESPLKPDAELRQAFATAVANTNGRAAEGLAAFARDHARSPLAINAAIRAGRLYLSRGVPEGALKLLDPAVEPLLSAVATAERKVELVVALQIRAEAALQNRQTDVAIAALQQSATWIAAAPPEAGYDRLRLLLQAQLSAGAPAAAVTAAEQLKALTDSGPLTNRRPEAVSQLGRALLKSGDTVRAMTVFADNLVAGTPIPLLREATLQVAEIDRRAGRLVPARLRLETFIAAVPTDPQLDRIRWALGQILYAQYQAGLATTNNPALLGLAEAHLAAALTNTTPELRGDIQLLRGWCLWEGGGGTNKLAEAGDAFAEAAATLPRTPAQAVARFKVADVRFRQGLPAAALTNYLAVAEGYDSLPDVESRYVTLAWQQAVAAAIATTNFPVAQRAMEQLIARDPRAEATAEGLLQLSNEYARQGNPPRGRLLLEQFIARFPKSPLLPELELSVADALRREERWPAALGAYDRWLVSNPSQTNRPWAEFGRAMVLMASGGTTNAMEQFLQLANRYPNDRLAPLALISLGDHYYQQEEFGQAEQAYTSVLTNAAWKGSARQHEAQLRAAQAAMGWKQFGRAQERLRELLNDQTTPAEFLPEGYFMLGQARLLATSPDTNAPLASVNEALDAFKAVTTFTNSPYLPEAWLAMAECHRQLAANNNPASYAAARELFERVLDPKLSIEPSLRARAKIGLGKLAWQQSIGRPTAEATPLENEALDHFLDVAFGRIVAITGPLEAKVLRDAGYEAGLILEARGLAKRADDLYEKLGSELPGMRSWWENRRARLKLK